MTHNRENAVILNNVEQHIFKDIIVKFGFSHKIFKLHLYMIKYRAYIICFIYRAFKKVEAYLNILNAKTQM